MPKNFEVKEFESNNDDGSDEYGVVEKRRQIGKKKVNFIYLFIYWNTIKMREIKFLFFSEIYYVFNSYMILADQ